MASLVNVEFDNDAIENNGEPRDSVQRSSRRTYDINDADPGSTMHPSLLETNCDEDRLMIENAIKEKNITPSQRYG